VLSGLHAYHLVRANHQIALELSGRVFELAQKLQDPLRLAVAHWTMGSSLIETGHPGPAWEHFRQGIALAEAHQSRGRPFHNPAITCRCYGARALTFLGRVEEGRQQIEQALALSRVMRHPLNYAFALMVASFLHQYNREPGKAEEYCVAMTSIAREHGLLHLSAFGCILEGRIFFAKGQLEESAAKYREGLDAFGAINARVGRPHFLMLLAETLASMDKLEEALATIRQAVLEVEETGERYFEAEIHRVHGMVLGSLKDPAAEESLNRALAIARDQSARTFELRTSVCLARMWREQGQRLSGGYRN